MNVQQDGQTQQAPFDFMGVMVTCHGQQLILNQSSPGVCPACQGMFTIADVKINYARPSQLTTPTQLPNLRM